MNPQSWWFLARATGLVAYALLSATVVGGLLLSTRRPGRRPAADWMLDWHRFVGALAVVFTAAHLATIWADDYIDFGLADLLIPFMSGWRTIAVGCGVLALYLTIAVETTSLLRRRLPHKLWRRIHYLSTPAFALATAHLFMAGEDASNPVVLIIVGASLGTTTLLIWFRVVPSGAGTTPRADQN